MNFTRPALPKDVGGTLSFDVPEGTPLTATVTITDPFGNADVSGASATVTTTGGITTLTYSVGASVCDTLAETYLAKWSYTISGTTYTRTQLFEVVASAVYPTLNHAKLTTVYARLLNARFPPGVTSFANEIAVAWGRVLQRVIAYGKNPNKIIDPQPLEFGHACYAASIIAANYKPGGATDGDWQQWAAAKLAEGDAALDVALANIPYDANQSGGIDAAEAHTGARTLRLSR